MIVLAIACLLMAWWGFWAPKLGIITQFQHLWRVHRAIHSSRLAAGERVLIDGVIRNAESPPTSRMAPRVWQKKALTIVDWEGEGGTTLGSEIKEFHVATQLVHRQGRMSVDLRHVSVTRAGTNHSELKASAASEFAPHLVAQYPPVPAREYKLEESYLLDGDPVLIAGLVSASEQDPEGPLVLKGTPETPMRVFAGSLKQLDLEHAVALGIATLGSCAVAAVGVSLLFR